MKVKPVGLGSAAVFSAALVFAAPALGQVVVNEFLADPPAGEAGDANRDGSRSASQDEFVELLNGGPDPVDLSGWTLEDEVAVRHQFAPGTSLGPSDYLVVFAGGTPTGFSGQVVTASSGALGLNNAGDQVVLKNAQGQVVDQVAYGAQANQDQSLTRFPEGIGPFLLHQDISSQGLLFSPGADPEGGVPLQDSPQPQPQQPSQEPPLPEPPLQEPPLPEPTPEFPLSPACAPSAATPEPASALLVGAGWMAMRVVRRCRSGRGR